MIYSAGIMDLGIFTRISGMESPGWYNTLYHYLGASATLDKEAT